MAGCSQRPLPEKTRQKATMSEMVGQMLMVGFRGLEICDDSWIVAAVEDLGLGGVVLYDRDVLLKQNIRNIASPEQLRRLVLDLQSRSRIPLLVAVDQEGGKVSRLKPRYGFPTTMSAEQLGRIGKAEETRKAARHIGRTLAKVGINCDLAPVVDVNVNPENPAIGRLGRSFSGNPQVVASQAKAFIQGLHDAKILACIKHFPGHGSAWNDSHLGLTDVTSTWSAIELEPFTTLIQDGVCDAVMTGHLFNARIDSNYPATLSVKTLKGILRERLGFKGLIISDDMQMSAITKYYGLEEAVYRFIAAGGDVLLFANNLQYNPSIVETVHGLILDMIAQGRIHPSQIERSYRRIMSLKSRLQ
jgi:beta-N-acetylhexosaminidase